MKEWRSKIEVPMAWLDLETTLEVEAKLARTQDPEEQLEMLENVADVFGNTVAEEVYEMMRAGSRVDFEVVVRITSSTPETNEGESDE